MNIINDISNFIFVDNKPRKSDIIFIPGGSWPEPTERAASLWIDGFATYVLPSGKFNMKRGFFPGAQSKKDIYPEQFETEWDFSKHILMKLGVDKKAILKEDQASEGGTYDNAFFSRAVTDSLGLVIQRGIICCKSFHARRALMTYQWAYPETELLVCPVEDNFKANWFENESGRKRVMSELEKCGKYFSEAVGTYINNVSYSF